jgi:hypothetical protein
MFSEMVVLLSSSVGESDTTAGIGGRASEGSALDIGAEDGALD